MQKSIMLGGMAITVGLTALVLGAKPTEAAYTRTPEVVFHQGASQVESFFAYAKSFTGGVEVAAGDINGDGVDEIITAPGAGGGPHIKVFSQEGQVISQFFAYSESMRSGVNVAVGDLDGDGMAEIVTVPKAGQAPQIRIFSSLGEPRFTPSFLAYDANFRGGVNIAIGDIQGDGFGEIFTAPESGGGPHVRSFDRYGKLLSSFFAFHQKFTGGVSLATADVYGDGTDELITGVARYEAPVVKVYDLSEGQRIIGSFNAFDAAFKGGVNVAAGDLDGNGREEIVASAQSGGGPHVRGFTADGHTLSINGNVFESSFRGGVNVAVGYFSGSADTVISGPSAWLAEGRADIEKYIEVDISEQRLYAYQDGRLVKTFLVSTGLPGWDTRPGSFAISQKVYSKDYSGAGYYFPNTLWNMRFDGSRLLHGAYWHNNFGKKRSHGCVNLPYAQAEWLYNWSAVGTPVTVRN